MANPFFGPYGPYEPYTYPQYPPWTYQRSYPFPGFRQTGACPQHGAFYGHGACFQVLQNQPAGASPVVSENTHAHVNSVATDLGPFARQIPVSTGSNAISTTSPSNILSARAETFVPICAQNTISSVGDSDVFALENTNIDQRLTVRKDAQSDCDHSVLPNVPGQIGISQDITRPQNNAAAVDSANDEAGRHPTLTPDLFVHHSSPVSAFQENVQPFHQSLFPCAIQERTNVKFLFDIHMPYCSAFVLLIIA